MEHRTDFDFLSDGALNSRFFVLMQAQASLDLFVTNAQNCQYKYRCTYAINMASQLNFHQTKEEERFLRTGELSVL